MHVNSRVAPRAPSMIVSVLVAAGLSTRRTSPTPRWRRTRPRGVCSFAPAAQGLPADINLHFMVAALRCILAVFGRTGCLHALNQGAFKRRTLQVMRIWARDLRPRARELQGPRTHIFWLTLCPGVTALTLLCVGLSRGILKKGTVTFEAPQKTATGRGSQPEQSQPGGTRAGNLLGKSSVLVSVLSANLHGDQPQHTESSQASAAEKDPRRAHRNAPAAVLRNPSGEEDDDFSFSQDLASLSEILKGGGISEERLARQAETRSSSVHEFRQLREKRASIFKGALRIQKKGPSTAAVKGAVRVGQSLYGAADRAQRSGFCAPRGTHAAPAAVVGAGGQTLFDSHSVAKTSVTPCRGRGGVASGAVQMQGTGADKDKGIAAPVVLVPATMPEATPSRKALPGESKTPRSICKSGGGGSYGGGTTGFGAKADMTPSNLRAKGVAGIFGSLLKDRARTAAMPSGAVPGAVRVVAEVEGPALTGGGIAMQLDMGNEDVSSARLHKSPTETTCAHASPAERPNAKSPLQQMAVLPESRQRASLGSAEICVSNGLSLEPDTRVASAMQALNKHAHEAASSGNKGRSRKSILLAEARQRVGAKTPPRRKLAQGSLMLASTSSAVADPNAIGNGLESTSDVMEPVSDSQSAVDAALVMELASLWNSPQGRVDAETSSQDNDRAANPVGGISTMDKGAWLFGRGVEWGRATPLVFTSTIDIPAGKSLALLKPVCKRACADDKAAVRHEGFSQAWSENASIAVSNITMGGAAWSRGISSVHTGDNSSVNAASPLATLVPSSLHSAPSEPLAPSQVPTPPRGQTALPDEGERKFTVVCDVEPEDEATLFDGDDEVVMLIHSKKSAEDRARGNFDHRKTILLESASQVGTA